MDKQEQKAFASAFDSSLSSLTDIDSETVIEYLENLNDPDWSDPVIMLKYSLRTADTIDEAILLWEAAKKFSQGIK